MGRPSTEQVARFIAWSWLLAGISVAVLQVGHAGFHERNELPPLLHWLRDASLAVPIAAFALIVAALVVVQARPESLHGRASLGTAGSWALLAAVAYAALSVPLIQLHGLLFGAEVRAGVSPLAHALGEGVTVFQVALLLVPASLLAGVPWRDSRQPAPDRAATNDATDPVPSVALREPAIQAAALPKLEGADR
jgi:hypothetical protein